MVNEVESLSFAGQVILDGVQILTTNGVGFNVINQVQGFELFEDIFSPFITGTVTILESLDLLNLFPLVGEETIRLSFHTPTIDKIHHRNQSFYIYKMTDGQGSGDRSNIYVLHFISVESIVDMNTKLSRTYQGRVSDIARKLLKEPFALNTKKQINVEDCPSVTSFTANYWSPMKCINHIAGTAKNNNNSASYIFFENSQGLNFVTLDSLYAQSPMHMFQQNNYSRDIAKGTGSAMKDWAKDFQKIQDFHVPDGFDYIDRSRGGMYGSQMITVDPITKKYSSRLYGGNTDFTTLNHLNPNSLISKNAIARAQQKMIYMPKHYGNFNGYIDVTNASVIQQRTSLLKMSDACKVSISVLGRTDYTVGQKVYVEIPSKEPMWAEDKDHIDRVQSGNYLIGAIAHRVTRTSHMCDMELIKDSMLIDLNKGSPKK